MFNILLTFFLPLFIAYNLLGILAGAIEVKYRTGRDTWSNLVKHKKIFFKYCFGWVIMYIKLLLKIIHVGNVIN